MGRKVGLQVQHHLLYPLTMIWRMRDRIVETNTTTTAHVQSFSTDGATADSEHSAAHLPMQDRGRSNCADVKEYVSLHHHHRLPRSTQRTHPSGSSLGSQFSSVMSALPFPDEALALLEAASLVCKNALQIGELFAVIAQGKEVESLADDMWGLYRPERAAMQHFWGWAT